MTRLTLTTRPTLECGVCGGPLMDREERMKTAAIFGIDDVYLVCPCCYTEQDPRDAQDEAYRTRVRSHIFQATGKILRVRSKPTIAEHVGVRPFEHKRRR